MYSVDKVMQHPEKNLHFTFNNKRIISIKNVNTQIDENIKVSNSVFNTNNWVSQKSTEIYNKSQLETNDKSNDKPKHRSPVWSAVK